MNLKTTIVTSVLCVSAMAIIATVLPSTAGHTQNKFYATPNRGIEGGKGNTQIKMLMDENVSRSSETTQNATDISVLEGRMGTAEGDISALEASQTAQDTQIGNNSTTISSNTGRIGTLESDMADVEGHAKAPIPGTCHDQNAKLRWNTTSSAWECVAEGDPTVKPFAKNNLPTCSASQLLRSNGSGFQCVNAGESYVITESDPKVGATTSNQWCRGTGSQVTCDQTAPSGSDPRIGSLGAGKWCTSNGSTINCSSDAPTGTGGSQVWGEWVDVTSSRMTGNSYQNTSQTSLMVYIDHGSNLFPQVSSDGSSWISFGIGESNNWSNNSGFVVPPGHYYRLMYEAQPSPPRKWVELEMGSNGLPTGGGGTQSWGKWVDVTSLRQWSTASQPINYKNAKTTAILVSAGFSTTTSENPGELRIEVSEDGTQWVEVAGTFHSYNQGQFTAIVPPGHFYRFIAPVTTFKGLAFPHGQNFAELEMGSGVGGGTPTPPTCIGTGKALQWDGSQYICGDLGGAQPTPVLDLAYGQHSTEQCHALSGAVVTADGAKICRFSQAGCPAGWAQYQDWSTTTAATCTGQHVPNACGGGKTCTTGSHTWKNASVELCQYYSGGYAEQGECQQHPSILSCSAAISQTGCY